MKVFNYKKAGAFSNAMGAETIKKTRVSTKNQKSSGKFIKW
jgi:hypothetical protein